VSVNSDIHRDTTPARAEGFAAGQRWLDNEEISNPYPAGTAEEAAWEHGVLDALNEAITNAVERASVS
jgi:hypothetical protein